MALDSPSPTDTVYPSPLAAPFHPQQQHPAASSAHLPASYTVATMQDDAQQPPSSAPIALSESPSPAPPAPTPSPSLEVDPQIIEALRSKDRIYVLKLGETFEALIMERRQRVEISPATSYQRLLVHRCSAYYKLSPESDPVTKGICVLTTAESRIPDRRLSELVPAEATAQPSFKIMRRSVPDRRSKHHAGDDQELSDPEQSESGSLGGQSHAGNKKRMTIEEREAAYNKARSRIFMDFEEKEKVKEKDMSASSSTLSLNGSASTSAGGGRSSLGDTDDAASSPATESEWSLPSGSNTRDKRDGRRGGPNSTSASSSRLRNPGAFNSSGGSSRNSRAPSPSFSYASLHDNPMGGHIFDPAHPAAVPNYYSTQYAYPYPPAAQGPAPAFVPHYQFYPQHYSAYQPPPSVPQHNASDPSTPASAEPYSPQQHMGYVAHYAWAPHPQQPPVQSPPPHTMHVSHPPPPQQNSHPIGPTPSMPPQIQYSSYPTPPVHAYTYPMAGYYPPQAPPPNGQQMPPPPPPNMSAQQHPPQSAQPTQLYQTPSQAQPHSQHHHQPQHAQPPPHQPSADYGPRGGGVNGHPASSGHYSNNNSNHNGPRSGLGNGVISPNNNNGRTASRGSGSGSGGNNSGMNTGNGGYSGAGSNNSNSNNNNNGKQQRGPPPPPSSQRSAWSYGPGISQGPGLYTPMPPSAGEHSTVGPRLSSMSRRASGNSSSGSNSRASSNCDEVSSTSSTTSSSSRRTYTSTTSSQHPLPARPDWAVGLKAQPTLTLAGANRQHHDSLNAARGNMSPISRRLSPAAGGHSAPMGRSGGGHRGRDGGGGARVTLEPQDFPPLTTAGGEKRPPVVSGAWGNARPVLPVNVNSNANVAGGSGSGAGNQQLLAMKQEENDETKLLVRRIGSNGVEDDCAGPSVADLAEQVAAVSIDAGGSAHAGHGENGVVAQASTGAPTAGTVDGESTTTSSTTAAATTTTQHVTTPAAAPV